MEQTLKIYQDRINELGIAGTKVQYAGGNRILVQVPGIETKEANRIKEILIQEAHLEFREVIDAPEI